MTDIVAAIDAAIGCQQCGGPLGGSPSGDFCAEDCQAAWHAARVGARRHEAFAEQQDAERRLRAWRPAARLIWEVLSRELRERAFEGVHPGHLAVEVDSVRGWGVFAVPAASVPPWAVQRMANAPDPTFLGLPFRWVDDIAVPVRIGPRHGRDCETCRPLHPPIPLSASLLGVGDSGTLSLAEVERVRRSVGWSFERFEADVVRALPATGLASPPAFERVRVVMRTNSVCGRLVASSLRDGHWVAGPSPSEVELAGQARQAVSAGRRVAILAATPRRARDFAERASLRDGWFHVSREEELRGVEDCHVAVLSGWDAACRPAEAREIAEAALQRALSR